MPDLYNYNKKKDEQTMIEADTGKRKKEQFIENLREGDVVNDLYAVKIKNPPRSYKRGTWFGLVARRSRPPGRARTDPAPRTALRQGPHHPPYVLRLGRFGRRRGFFCSAGRLALTRGHGLRVGSPGGTWCE